MNLKRLSACAALAIIILTITTGCGRVNLFAGPSPTSPPTRTPRPTFTPRPLDTDTPEATEAPTETEAPVATDTSVPPTKRPVATARPKPPTQPPEPTSIPPTAGPTASPYQYLFFPLTCNPGDDPAICNIQSGGVKCLHSGNHYIDVFVASDYHDPNGSRLAGIRVRFSFQPGGAKIEPDETTAGDGKAEKTLTGPGVPLGKNVGTYYAWLINDSGNQISNFSPAIQINALSEDHSDTCISAIVGFAGGH